MKGAAEPTFIHYAGKTDDFILFIDDVDQYKEWIATQDASTNDAVAADVKAELGADDVKAEPGADDTKAGDDDAAADFVVPAFVTAKDQLFVTHKQGAQGKKDSASKASIASEFDPAGTIGKDKAIKNVAIKTILLKGRLMEQEFPERQGSKNDADGPMVAH